MIHGPNGGESGTFWASVDIALLTAYLGNVLTSLSHAAMLTGMPTEPWAAEVLWPDEERGPWLVTIWWRIQHGAAVPVGFALRAWIENDFAHFKWRDALPLATVDVEFPSIGSQLVKDLPIGRLVEASRQKLLADLGSPRREKPSPDLPEGWEAWEQVFRDIRSDLLASTVEERHALRQPRPRRGRDLGEEHYREVAQVYAAAARAGRPPTTAVAEHFTVTKSAAAKKVARARDRGYLPPTTRGRVGRLARDL